MFIDQIDDLVCSLSDELVYKSVMGHKFDYYRIVAIRKDRKFLKFVVLMDDDPEIYNIIELLRAFANYEI